MGAEQALQRIGFGLRSTNQNPRKGAQGDAQAVVGADGLPVSSFARRFAPRPVPKLSRAWIGEIAGVRVAPDTSFSVDLAGFGTL